MMLYVNSTCICDVVHCYIVHVHVSCTLYIVHSTCTCELYIVHCTRPESAVLMTQGQSIAITKGFECGRG